MDDSNSLRTPVLNDHPNYGFKSLRTIPIVLLLIFFLLTEEFIALYFFFMNSDSSVSCDRFFVIVYAQISWWIINFIARFGINREHKVYLIAKGYFEFYENVSKYIEIPFYISCIWMVTLNIIACIYIENGASYEFFCHSKLYYSPVIVMVIAVNVLNAMLIPSYVIYIIKVKEFNKSKSPPDSEIGNQWMPTVLRETISSGDMGFRERGEVIDNMLEKQADLIRYYKEANEVLNKKIFDLTAQGRAILNS